MILGIGNDIVDISRFNKVLTTHRKKFLTKYFLPNEIAYACMYKTKFTEKMASAWAVKEATAKALGTGIDQGVTLQDIELVRNTGGVPAVVLHHTAHQVAKTISGDSTYDIFVSVSHDGNMAFATVILQKQK